MRRPLIAAADEVKALEGVREISPQEKEYKENKEILGKLESGEIDISAMERKLADNPEDTRTKYIIACYCTKTIKDFKRAVRLLEELKSFNPPYADAINKLGTLYEKGRGVDKDQYRAFKLYQQAADLGFERAIGNFARCYDKGIGVDKDPKKAVRLFQQTIDSGCTACLYNMGYHYYVGNGVDKDINKAVQLYKQAADSEDDFGMFALGCCYAKGIGVKKDINKAVKLFQQAADLKNRSALRHLGDLYQDGVGVDKDINKAILFYAKSATKDDNNNPLLSHRFSYSVRADPKGSSLTCDELIKIIKSPRLCERTSKSSSTLIPELVKASIVSLNVSDLQRIYVEFINTNESSKGFNRKESKTCNKLAKLIAKAHGWNTNSKDTVISLNNKYEISISSKSNLKPSETIDLQQDRYRDAAAAAAGPEIHHPAPAPDAVPLVPALPAFLDEGALPNPSDNGIGLISKDVLTTLLKSRYSDREDELNAKIDTFAAANIAANGEIKLKTANLEDLLSDHLTRDESIYLHPGVDADGAEDLNSKNCFLISSQGESKWIDNSFLEEKGIVVLLPPPPPPPPTPPVAPPPSPMQASAGQINASRHNSIG